MGDENKEVAKNESNEQKAQLSEEALGKVAGGGTPKKSEPTVSESVSIAYEQIQYQYYTQD